MIPLAFTKNLFGYNFTIEGDITDISTGEYDITAIYFEGVDISPVISEEIKEQINRFCDEYVGNFDVEDYYNDYE